MIEAQGRPGFTAIEAVSRLAPDAGEWTVFVRKVLLLPLEMLPAVQHVVKCRKWAYANDPLESVRRSAELCHLWTVKAVFAAPR